MKGLHLFEAVGLVDDRLVEEAADAGRAASPWGKWLAAAACVALALSLGTATAGTLLRGCGNKSAGMADLSAAPADAPSEETAPVEREEYEMVTGDAAAPLAPPAEPAAPAPEAAPEAPASEPAAEPESPEPAEAPGAPFEDGMLGENAMGGLRQGIFGLRADGEAASVTALDSGGSGAEEAKGVQARYRVENQSGAACGVRLHFTLDTGEAGMEGRTLTIRIDGNPVSFDAYEMIVCPSEDGGVPEEEGRHFLIEFTVSLPAQGGVDVEILDAPPAD